ncbi:hypothetical protein BKA63DRAFT_283867 [Paraphoma chrysanthemicola]|nr:hypothetical protein BKA63DRAFT_283867 [Paraphoma chrysanthemicola]
MAQNKNTEGNENTITLAEILSDLVSLRVCDPAASLALVSARPDQAQPPSSTSDPDAPQTSNSRPDEEDDVDLKRAKDLLKYHYGVKEAHRMGKLNRGLDEARSSVARAVGS